MFLDGWKDLCLPVPRLLEPRLSPRALVVADVISHPSMAGYLAYVRDPVPGYVTLTFPVEDGMEVSCFTGGQDRPSSVNEHVRHELVFNEHVRL